jgi:hypothetical protein
VLCLIIVPLPSGKNSFAVQLNNNNISHAIWFSSSGFSAEMNDTHMVQQSELAQMGATALD